MDIKEAEISNKQFKYIVALFLQGTLLYITYFLQKGGRDTYIMMMVAAIGGILIGCLNAGFTKLYPGGDIVTILCHVFGGVIGKIFGLVYGAFFLLICAINLRQTGQFVASNLLPDQNWIIIAVVFTIVCLYAAKNGPGFFSYIGAIGCFFLLFMSAVLLLCVLPHMDKNHFMPVMVQPVESYVDSLIFITAVPFSEIFMLLMFAPYVRGGIKKGSYIKGIIIATIFIVASVVRIIAVFGPLIKSFSYPSFEIIYIINLGSSLSRVESFFSPFIIFALFIRVAIMLFCITKLACRVIGEKKRLSDYMIYIVSVLLLILTVYIADSNEKLLEIMLNLVGYVTFVMLVILPIIIFIIATVKNKKKVVT
ncbi:MAG: hypothetical protein E7385_03570 [Ruminococcaceae bacterium]|nr:hypothetical protein [Oscillospiraceae bacterium]